MFTIIGEADYTQDIRKSVFRARAVAIASEDDAKDQLARLSEPGANHNCWAFRLGQIYRFSDDGEPSGTAGKPILQAIDGQEMDRLLVVVTRWFGGTLLGSGGLIRAYGGTAAACLREASRQELIETIDLGIRTSFSDLALVRARIEAAENATIRDEQFLADGAEFTARLPVKDAERLAQMLTDQTSGRIRIAWPD